MKTGSITLPATFTLVNVTIVAGYCQQWIDMNSRVRPTKALLMLLSASAALASCAHKGSEQTEAPLLLRFLPPPEDAEVVYLTAAAEGRLIYEDGCFKLRTRGQPPQTVIWHSHFSGINRNGKPGIVDENTGISAIAGDYVRIGGGVVDSIGDNVEDRALAQGCGGPYTSANTLRRVEP